MFQLITPATVKLMHINVRTEKHGPADVDAFDLDFQIGGENQKVLALLHPDLCAALCHDEDGDDGQETVEGVPPHLPNIRFPKLAEALPWTEEATGVDLTVIYGLGNWQDEIRSLVEGVINEFGADLLRIVEMRQEAFARKCKTEAAAKRMQLATIVAEEPSK